MAASSCDGLLFLWPVPPESLPEKRTENLPEKREENLPENLPEKRTENRTPPVVRPSLPIGGKVWKPFETCVPEWQRLGEMVLHTSKATLGFGDSVLLRFCHLGDPVSFDTSFPNEVFSYTKKPLGNKSTKKDGWYSPFSLLLIFPLHRNFISLHQKSLNRPRQTGVNSFTLHLASILPWIGPVAGSEDGGQVMEICQGSLHIYIYLYIYGLHWKHTFEICFPILRSFGVGRLGGVRNLPGGHSDGQNVNLLRFHTQKWMPLMPCGDVPSNSWYPI